MTEQPNTERDDERLSRLTGDVPQRVEEEPDNIVAEYEARYYGKPKREPEKAKRDKPRSYSTMNITDEEKTWAAVAHGSFWLTMVAAFFTAGTVVPLLMFLPLGIYFMYRKRSDFVAFHALQAFVLQLIGTVGVLTLLAVGAVVWVVGLMISILLIAVLVGVILVPIWALVGVLFFLVTSLLPFVGLLFATIALIRTSRGSDYRYPYVAHWIDRQMSGGLLS